MYNENVIEQMKTKTYGNRSFTRVVQKHILETSQEEAAATLITEMVAVSSVQMYPMTNTARKLAERLLKLTGIDGDDLGDQKIIRLGMHCIDWVADAGYVKAVKQTTIGKKTKEMWYVEATDKDFYDWALSLSEAKYEPPMDQGAFKWTGPTLMVDENLTVDICRKARRHGLLHNYKGKQEVYDALNRLNAQEFVVNQDVFVLASSEHPFNPRLVPDAERKAAMFNLMNVRRKAMTIEELKFKQRHKWLVENIEDLDDGAIERIAAKQAKLDAEDYEIVKSETHLKVVSDWSKRVDHEEILKRAYGVKHSVINYLWNGDSRGRQYPTQNYFSPIGSDLAKALLLFAKPMQVSGFDLAFSIANTFGEDKLSAEGRVAWTNEHSEELYEIGCGVVNELFEKLAGEKKTKWQGIAHCIEWVKYCDYVNATGSDEGFTTALPIGLDARSSGVQLLTAIGRDETVAPYVLGDPKDGKLEDFYQYIGNALAEELHAEDGLSDTLKAMVKKHPVGSKIYRKLAKRCAMTFSYSATRQGMQQFTWDDRKDHGCETTANLTIKDCRDVGSRLFDLCNKKIDRAAQLMQYFRDAVDAHKGGAIISWWAPDGWFCWQAKDKSREKHISDTIGGTQVDLTFYVWQDKADKQAHKNAISPDWVHSIDSYVLRSIVRKMPLCANIVTVHDQFSTDSYYVPELQQAAKEAYYAAADREQLQAAVEDAFNEELPLPAPGNWNVEDIWSSDYIIC